jgi:hypothetical protein
MVVNLNDLDIETYKPDTLTSAHSRNKQSRGAVDFSVLSFHNGSPCHIAGLQ